MEADIGIIGGTGFYSLLDAAEQVSIDTQYGKPSSDIAIGTVSGVKVAFLSRHGKGHTLPPHKVPYAANIEALSKLGVKRIIATTSMGSLKQGYMPGDIVILDQFVNMTQGRRDTFFDGPDIRHTSVSDPYCKGMAEVAVKEAAALGIRHQKSGTVVVVNGPRFSTRAESRLFIAQGFDVICMTQYPEPVLAREKGICYSGIGVVTDYDNGVGGSGEKTVTFDEIKRNFDLSMPKVKSLVLSAIPKIASLPKCTSCSQG